MKSKLITVGLMVVMALSLLACSPAANEEPVVPSHTTKTAVFFYTCDDFMNQKHIIDEVTIAVDDGVNVILCSNPTTGFSWQPAVISDEAVLKQEGESEFVSPDEAIPGASGKEKWTFKALKTGTSTVAMEYSRPWEGGEKGEWTYELTVTVK